jgi:hypothetical protein
VPFEQICETLFTHCVAPFVQTPVDGLHDATVPSITQFVSAGHGVEAQVLFVQTFTLLPSQAIAPSVHVFPPGTGAPQAAVPVDPTAQV